MTYDPKEIYQILHGYGRFGTPRLGTASNRRCDGFLALASFMFEHSQIGLHPSKKEDSEWISPAILYPGATGRKIKDIEFLSPFIPLDIDTAGWTIERLRQAFHGLKCIIHTTTCSTHDHPRWRVLPMLDRGYTPEEYASVWRYFNHLTDGALDPATKDASRIAFLPKTWRGMLPATHTGERGTDANPINYNFYEVREGICHASVDDALRDFPIIVPPPPVVSTASVSVNGTIEIVQDWMWQRELGKPRGGRMYRILQRAARRFKQNGWVLTADALASDALRVNPFISPSDQRDGINHEAGNAISWAGRNVETLPETYNIFIWKKS